MTYEYDLQRGDDDAERLWGGTVRGSDRSATAASGPLSSVAIAGPVSNLQRDLRVVGIGIGPEPNGKLERSTEWAIREFQLYAKMATVAKEDTKSAAQEYVDRLSAVTTGTARYGGPVSGVSNAATRAALKHWLANDWRCPVVLDAWNDNAKPPVRVVRNVWHPRDETQAGLVIKARDFSGYYRPQAATDLWPLGRNWRYLKTRGPITTVDEAERAVEVLPETLVGSAYANLSGAEKSTFGVVRAVTEVECFAFFDTGNAYDIGIESVGIFHFIISTNGAGELSGVLHRLMQKYLGDYERNIRFFGVDVAPPDPKKDAVRFKLCNDAGTYVEPNLNHKDEAQRLRLVAAYGEELEYLRHWHWYYRFAMMSRTTEPFRREQWLEALSRLRLIRRFRIEAEHVTPMNAGSNPPVLATFGDVFTSELAMAYVLRWHVNRPVQVITSREVGGRQVPCTGKGIVEALNDAKKAQPQLAWSSPPSTWTTKEEDALIAGIETARTRTAEVRGTLPHLKKFPTKARYWTLDPRVVPKLSTTRGSFQMASAPAPQPSAPPAPTPTPPPGPAPGPTPPVAPAPPPGIPTAPVHPPDPSR